MSVPPYKPGDWVVAEGLLGGPSVGLRRVVGVTSHVTGGGVRLDTTSTGHGLPGPTGLGGDWLPGWSGLCVFRYASSVRLATPEELAAYQLGQMVSGGL